MAIEPEDDPGGRSALFLYLLLLHLTVRDAVRFLESGADLRLVWSLGFATCLAVSFFPKLRRGAALAALMFATSKWLTIFPHNSNHFFLELLCLVFASVWSWRIDAERVLFLRSVRWLPVLVMIWSGINKALYGTYYNGAFLATVLPSAGFAGVFGWLLPADELRTLLAAQPPGPYVFSAPLALLASNLVWFGEIVCGVLLLIPRWRLLGMLGGIGLLVGIELGAFEVMFGTLMLNMLVLYAPAVWSWRVLVASVLFYASLVGAKLGWLPMWAFN